MMRVRKSFLALLTAGAISGIANASTASYTGTLLSPEDYNTKVITLGVAGTVTLQTWSFGGGKNADGNTIPAGGFDPLVGIFTGTGPSATIIDATSDVLSNYPSYVGCPPAGTVIIGSTTGVCGDITMSFVLSPGMYTVLLADGEYIPNAVFDNGTLGEGFTDFTAGVFQTCADSSCITPSANWALDITTPTVSTSVPEPGPAFTVGLVVLSVLLIRRLGRVNRNS